jgi:hypothetical protein
LNDFYREAEFAPAADTTPPLEIDSVDYWTEATESSFHFRRNFSYLQHTKMAPILFGEIYFST